MFFQNYSGRDLLASVPAFGNTRATRRHGPYNPVKSLERTCDARMDQLEIALY